MSDSATTRQSYGSSTWYRATRTQVQLTSDLDGDPEILALRAGEKARLGKAHGDDA